MSFDKLYCQDNVNYTVLGQTPKVVELELNDTIAVSRLAPMKQHRVLYSDAVADRVHRGHFGLNGDLGALIRRLGDIFGDHKPRIFITGGSFSDSQDINDIDLFFYDCDELDVVEYIQTILGGMDYQSYVVEQDKLYIDRGDNIDLDIRTHIFDSPENIIAGFDLINSQIGYDMHRRKMLLSQFNHWCIANNALPLVPWRLGTTGASRILKYCRKKGYDIILPYHPGGDTVDLYLCYTGLHLDPDDQDTVRHARVANLCDNARPSGDAEKYQQKPDDLNEITQQLSVRPHEGGENHPPHLDICTIYNWGAY